VSTRFGFAGVVRDVERRLEQELGLDRLALDPELERLSGQWRDRPVRLEARAYRGPRIAFARFVELESDDLEIGNVLCLPEPEYRLPIFGADLVGLGRDTAVVVADLSPVTPDEDVRQSQLEALQKHRVGRPAPEASAPLPPWAAAWFSRGALSRRLHLPEASEAGLDVSAFASAFIELSRSSASEPSALAFTASQQQGYCAAHREHDRGLSLLWRIFEPRVADRFLRHVLFPERSPS
jgi:phycocyanobilin:ferredoxin oxidoreductase